MARHYTGSIRISSDSLVVRHSPAYLKRIACDLMERAIDSILEGKIDEDMEIRVGIAPTRMIEGSEQEPRCFMRGHAP